MDYWLAGTSERIKIGESFREYRVGGFGSGLYQRGARAKRSAFAEQLAGVADADILDWAREGFHSEGADRFSADSEDVLDSADMIDCSEDDDPTVSDEAGVELGKSSSPPGPAGLVQSVTDLPIRLQIELDGLEVLLLTATKDGAASTLAFALGLWGKLVDQPKWIGFDEYGLHWQTNSPVALVWLSLCSGLAAGALMTCERCHKFVRIGSKQGQKKYCDACTQRNVEREARRTDPLQSAWRRAFEKFYKRYKRKKMSDNDYQKWVGLARNSFDGELRTGAITLQEWEKRWVKDPQPNPNEVGLK